MNEFKHPGNYVPPYLPEFFVWWDTIERQDLELLEEQIASAKNERDMQTFLETNPQFLIQHFGGGRGRWVLPQGSLGSEYRTDFIVGDKNSFGHEWEVVELESTKARAFTKAGNPTSQLTHAIRQITDWRAWLKRNQNYAARSRAEQGLGLVDIDANVRGLVLIGRESAVDPSTSDLRRQMVQDLKITIHTYDWLIRMARGRVEALERVRRVGLFPSFHLPAKKK